MNVAALQKADKWLGVPMCFALSLLRRIVGRADVAPKPLRRLLFVKLAEQGSTVLAYPAIRHAIENLGRENVYFLVLEENRFILDALDVVPRENVITIRGDDPVGMGLSLLKVVRQLRRLDFDAAVDMEFFSRGSAAITFVSGARNRAGFHSFHGEGPYRGDLMTHRLLFNSHLHTTDTFLSLVHALEEKPERLPTYGAKPFAGTVALPRFVPQPGELDAMTALLQREFGRKNLPPIVLLNPNASDLLPLRKWPADRYLELGRKLLQQFPEVAIAFTGAPSEAESGEALARSIGSPRCVSLAGKTTLRELLVLYTLSEVLVTNDSGPAHFASLTSLHVVTLFGPETPALFGARSLRHTTLWAGLPCSPCVNAFNNRQSSCRDNLCMQMITVDEVFDTVCKVYLQRINSGICQSFDDENRHGAV